MPVAVVVLLLMDARRVAAILATVGAGLWLSQALLLVVRGGVTPNAQIETVTFGVGFAAFIVAAGPCHSTTAAVFAAQCRCLGSVPTKAVRSVATRSGCSQRTRWPVSA